VGLLLSLSWLPAEAAKQSQTITFAPLVNKTYGDPPFTVSATASSGLTVTFSSLTTSVCSVIINSVMISSGGTCTIRASQAGNSHYLAAPNVDRSFTVAKANQTITFYPINDQPLSATIITISASTTSGLWLDFFSLTTSVCLPLSGGNSAAVQSSPTDPQYFDLILQSAGTCTIDVEQAGSQSYNPAPGVQRSFNVTGENQQSQTITFGALANKTYGDPAFTVSAAASSGLTVSFASLTTSACTVSGNTVTIIAAGTCTIQATQAGDANYAPAPPVNQSFTVAKANQTITFGALGTKTLGTPPFSISATASSGLAVSFTSLTSSVCTVSGSTVTLVALGTCTIQANQAGNANYNAALSVNQSFLVTAPISMSVAITSPANNATINADSVVVSGTLQAPSNSAVTVNGFIAVLDGNGHFYADVPLSIGANTITATATSPDSQTTNQSITVNRTASPNAAIIDADPVAGLSPLVVTFTIVPANGAGVQRVDLDYNDDGTIDNVLTSSSFTLTYSVPFVYRLKVIVTDTQLNVTSRSFVIQVIDKNQLDANLRAVWGSITSALGSGNISQALTLFTPSIRSYYQAVLTDIQPGLAAMFTNFPPIYATSMTESEVEYFVLLPEGGTNYGYYLYFAKDADGVWRLQAI
jgi:hypothetical protein